MPEITKKRGMIQPEMNASNNVNPGSGEEFMTCHGVDANGLLL